MNTKQIIIVGGGGLAREIFSWLNGKNVIGFLDDTRPPLLEKYNYPIKVLSSISDYIPEKESVHILGIMNPEGKKRVVSLLKEKGCKFTSFIHPTAIIGKNVRLGEGVVITPGCILSCDINIGDFVFLNTQSTIGHDVKVGNYTSINGKVEVSGFVHIGESVTIGSRVVILPKKKIANGAIIGAGSVVVGNINQAITVFGNPAKRL